MLMNLPLVLNLQDCVCAALRDGIVISRFLQIFEVMRRYQEGNQPDVSGMKGGV